MSLTHDLIKIKYVRLGYLPNYPYHLISDQEMFDAFIDLSNDGLSSSGDTSDVERFFEDYYPNPFEEEDIVIQGAGGEQISLNSEYLRLRAYIINTINQHLAHVGTAEEDSYTIPAWIYTYMLGEVIYNVPGNPDDFQYRDMHDLLVLLDADNIENEMTPEICKLCYMKSTKYISTLTTGIRPPTVFGEPHVIKQLRLEA
jgi:hypothetical protein